MDQRIAAFNSLKESLSSGGATAGVIGLGYVGLPLAAAIAKAGFATIGFDIDPSKINLIKAGASYVDRVKPETLIGLISSQLLRVSADFAELSLCDVILISVPTPLTRYREPDLSHVESATRTIAQSLRAGQLIILESTTFPGTTTGVVRPILEQAGLRSEIDFFLSYSPEREDPGNSSFVLTNTPKIVSGDGPLALDLASTFYGAVVSKIVPVCSMEVAEAVKLTENLFRAVNIALVNELKTAYAAMDIDVWEVIDAAATKPFGFMPFYPGPGLGGHCVPVDPYYFSWRARQYETSSRLVDTAAEINFSMPIRVVDIAQKALNSRMSFPLDSARVLVLGVAYKKNIADVRESSSLKLMQLFQQRGATVTYHDPLVKEIPWLRDYPELQGQRSVPLDRTTIETNDIVVLATDHDCIDYPLVAACARLIVDSRNVFARQGLRGEHIIKA